MKILFDIISTQDYMNGGAEYVCKIFSVLMNNPRNGCEVIAIYDSRKSFPYNEMSPDSLSKKGIRAVDIKGKKLANLIMELNIDTFFIGIAQRYIEYKLSEIPCRCICVIHDFSEYDLKGIREYIYRDRFFQLIRMKYRRIKDNLIHAKHRRDFYSFLNNHPNLSIITVSEFTRASLLNKVIGLERNVTVLYSPEKIANKNELVDNGKLNQIILSHRRFFLIVSAGRDLKNAKLALQAFKRYVELFAPDDLLVTIGYGREEFSNHVDLPFLSTSDLEHAYENCFTLIYPSLWEGFGYPPLEAMKYGKPVLCSNVCSMKEVLGDSPIYFSPFYESDIFASLLTLSKCKLDILGKLSIACYEKVRKKQSEDLQELVKMIMG